jgi:hypothetical protein
LFFLVHSIAESSTVGEFDETVIRDDREFEFGILQPFDIDEQLVIGFGFVDEGMMEIAGPFSALIAGYFAFALCAGIDEHVGGIYMHLIAFAFFHTLPKEDVITGSYLVFDSFVESHKLDGLELECAFAIFVYFCRFFVFAAYVDHVESVIQGFDLD